MALFVINTTATVALRKTEVRSLEIERIPLYTDPETYKYVLFIKLEDSKTSGIPFEEANTLSDIQTKAAAVLAALET